MCSKSIQALIQGCRLIRRSCQGLSWQQKAAGIARPVSGDLYRHGYFLNARTSACWKSTGTYSQEFLLEMLPDCTAQTGSGCSRFEVYCVLPILHELR